MPRVGREMQVSLRPRAMQVPRARHGTDHIVAALHDHTGDMPNLSDVFDEIVFRREETVVHKVMTFDPRKRLGKSRIGKSLDRFRIEKQLRGASFPDRPGARGFDANLVVLTREPAIISADHVVALILGNHLHVLFPNVREDPTAALLIKPLNLLRPAEKDAAQYQFGRAIRMRLGVSE